MNRRKLTAILLSAGLLISSLGSITSVKAEEVGNPGFLQAMDYDTRYGTLGEKMPLLTAAGYVGTLTPLNLEIAGKKAGEVNKILSKYKVIDVDATHNYGLMQYTKTGSYINDVAVTVLNNEFMNLNYAGAIVRFNFSDGTMISYLNRLYIDQYGQLCKEVASYSVGTDGYYHGGWGGMFKGLDTEGYEPYVNKYTDFYANQMVGSPLRLYEVGYWMQQEIGVQLDEHKVDVIGCNDPSKDQNNLNYSIYNDENREKTTKTQIDNTRIGGQTRFETSLNIAKQYVGDKKLDNVVLTSGYGFADALTGSMLAKKLNSPIFLLGSAEQNKQTLDYIYSKLSKDGHVYILGGTGAVPDSIKDGFIANGYSESNIVRLGGANRYETASKIAENENVITGTPVIIANGENFPDALSMSPVSASKGYPIVITTSYNLPDYAKDYLAKVKPSQVYVAGGTGAVDKNVLSQIKQYSGLSDDKITRFNGNDRYETSKFIGEKFFADSQNVTVASGLDYPDALSGSILSAENNAPIILSDNGLVIQSREYVIRLNANQAKITFLGGTGAISDNTIENTAGILPVYNLDMHRHLAYDLSKIPETSPTGN